MHYGMLIDLNTCAGCGACVMACKQMNGTPNGVWWQNIEFDEVGTYPNVKKTAMPAACMHCSDAPCLNNCPSGATTRDEFGVITVDNTVCIGCQTCIKSCPYNARHYLDKDPGADAYWGEGQELTPYEEFKTVERHRVGTVGKCIMCKDRLAEGKEPVCVQTCITKCRVFGDLDDPESELSRAIRELGAKPYKEELGTQPSVYYAGLEF